MRNVRRIALYSLLLLAAGLPAGAAAQDKENASRAPAVIMSAEAQADQKAIGSELTAAGPHRLDLGNPLHYRLIQQMLARAGESAEKSPELFKRLEASHAEAAAELARTSAAPRKAEPLQTQDPQPTPVDLNFIATFSRVGSQAYQATGLSSILGGSVTSTVVMELLDDVTGRVYATASKSQYGQGVNLRVQVTGTTQDTQNPTTLVQGMFAYVPLSNPNAPPVVLIQHHTDTLNPTDGCMLQPNYCVRNNLNQCVTGQYQTTCTNKVTNTQLIKMCWNRLSQQECDYWNSPAHPTDFVFPLSGNVTFPNTVVTPATGVVNIALQNPQKGGGCNVYFQQNAVLTSQYWTVNGKSIAWNFPASAFPNKGDCINYYEGTNVVLWMSAYIALQGTGGPALYGTINFTSDLSRVGLPGVYIIPGLQIWQGCFAAGTEITMDDGKTMRPIEDFVADGQEKVASGDGIAKVISGTTIGIEPDRDMVRLTTANGRSLLVTQGHPIVLDSGKPVLAKALQVGDRVRTLEGASDLIAVTRERYAGKVHNLIVNLGGGSHNDTIYANGILAGDANMQNELVRMEAEAQRKDPRLARSRLPSEWLKDFDNHQN
jgi:hypothetical protein